MDSGVNMSCRNARLVISALGYGAEYEEFNESIGHLFFSCHLFVRSEIQSIIDTGRRATVGKGDSGATVIDCELRAGYIREKVDQIRLACHKAMESGYTDAYFV